jgi:antitoxin (DNA-binding transcriptional repressor) of toxin-antitoxin stability system
VTQIRISSEELPAEFQDALARARGGDEVLVERDGRVIARVLPETAAVDWEVFFRELAALPRLDESFGNAVLEAVRESNRPAEDVTWES